MAHNYRIFIPADQDQACGVPRVVVLDDADSHHLRNVLRLRVGDFVTAVSRTCATEYEAQISDLTPQIKLTLKSQRPEATASLSPVQSLIFALCRGPANDLVLEKACELGVAQIIFWQAERSITKISQKDAQKKLERWQRIVESAAKQSGKCFTSKIELIYSLEQLNALLPASERRLCCSLLNRAVPIQKLNPPLTRTHLLVGPSADFSAKEEQLVESLGFDLVNLGPYRLRSETAAIAAISMVAALSDR